MAQRYEIDAIFRAVDQITDPIRRMAANVNRMSSKMEKKLDKVNGAIGRITGGAAAAGRAVAAAGIAAGAGLARVVTTGAEVEQVLINAGQRLGGIRRGTKAFDELQKSAVDMATATEHGSAEAAGALEFMGTASESAAVAMGTLNMFADSATANKVSLARAADIASDSIGSLGLHLDETGKLLDDKGKIEGYAKTVDMMTSAAQGANLTLDQVFETTKKSAKIFRDSGQSLETFFAATQVVSSTIKGAEAGTQLKIVMGNLLKTTGDTKKAFAILRRTLGKKIKLADTEGNIRALPDILDDVNRGLGKMNELQQTRVKRLLFGSEAVAVGSLLLSQTDDLRAKTEKMNDTLGVTAELAAVGRDSASGAFKSLGSTIEAIEIGIFSVIRDDVVRITKATTAWAQANKEAISKAFRDGLEFIRDNFDKIARVGPRILKLVAALAALAKILTVVQSIMAVVAALTTASAGMMGLIVLAVLAVIAVLSLAVFYWDEITAAMARAWEWMANMINPIIESMVGFWDRLTAGIKAGNAVWTTLGVVLGVVGAAVAAAFWQFTLLAAVAFLIVDNWEHIGGFFRELWDGIVQHVTESIDILMSSMDDFMRWANKFSGVQLFDMTAEDKAAQEAIERGIANFGRDDRPVVETLSKLGLDPEGLDDAAATGFAGEFGEDDSGPQVINTYGSILERSVQESIKRVSVDVNVKDKGGNVESVEQKGDAEGVTVQSSGDL